MYQAITFISSLIIILLCWLLFRKRSKESFSLLLKILVVAFCALGVVRLFLADSFIYVINGQWVDGKYNQNPDFLQSVLRWGYFVSYAVLPLAIFFESRLMKNLASYFCLPFAILSAIFIDGFMPYFLTTSTSELGYRLMPAIRYALFILELVLAIVVPVLMQINDKHVFNVKDKGEWLRFFISLPFVLFIMMPVYIPQSFFGFNNNGPKAFESWHWIWLAITVVGIMALYYIFRFKNKEQRYMVCLFLALALFYHYHTMYLKGVTIDRMPFQLCNAAVYMLLIGLIFKMEKFFHFCFIANIVGTIIAMILTNMSVGISAFWSVHYLVQHSLILAVPALAMGLRIFGRVSKKSLLYAWIGFTIFFLTVFVIGTYINGHATNEADKVNYFYMFDLKVAFEYVPFVTFTKNVHWTFGVYEVYPLLITIVYVAYLILCLAFFFVVKLLYKIEDDHLQLRLSSIDLYEKISGKKSKRPKEFID